MKFKYYLQISLWKTLRFNFRMFPFRDALKLPVILFRNTKINSLKGKVLIDPPLKHGMIKIGRNDVCGWEQRSTVLHLEGVVHFRGKTTIGSGSVIQVEKGAVLTTGDRFRITGGSTLYCRHRITFGKEALISWENLFMDSDHHDLLDPSSGKIMNPAKEILIGDHVWIGCRCTILKGSVIPDHCVVAAASVIKGVLSGSNSILTGTMSEQKVLRSQIDWKE